MENLTMPSQRNILRSWNDVALVEEKLYLPFTYLSIETTSIVTSERRPEGAYFSGLSAAAREFRAEIVRSKGKSSRDVSTTRVSRSI
jgi:hypothetical protein